MEKKIRNQRIVIAVLVVLLLFNLFTVWQIKEDLNRLNNAAIDRIEDVRSSVNSVLSEISRIKRENEKQISLITSFDYEYGELDESRMTVPVSVKIVPKAVGEDTALALEFGGRTVEMKKSASSTEFTAEFEAALFEQKEGGDVKLVITKDGTSETEELDWSLGSLHTQFLPFVAAYFAFDDITCNEKNGITVEGNVISHVDDDNAERFKSTKLLFRINGEVLSEDDINGDKIFNVNKTFPGYGAGDTFELYLEAVDELGFTHEALLKRVEFSTDGEPAEETEVADGDIVIKDKQGKVVYS